VKVAIKHIKNFVVPHEGNDYRPHLLRHESIMAVFMTIIVLELAFLAQVFIVFDKTKFLANVLPAVLTNLTNEERKDNEVPTLKENSLLVKAAQAKAEDMAKNGYFAHTSPEGKTPWYWLKEVGYSYKSAGENLAVNFFDSEDVSRAWMNSPTHRANIVKKEYTEIGIGIANGKYQGRNTVFVAQFFGTPLAVASITPVVQTPKPVTKPAVKTPEKVIEKETEEETTPIENELVQREPEQVLGEESAIAPIATETITKERSAVVSVFENILTSPKKSIGYMYGLLAMLFLLSISLGFLIRGELRHPKMLAKGFAMIAFIGLLSVINLRMLDHRTQVPMDEITANVIDVLPE
jgi:hypothetical protein